MKCKHCGKAVHQKLGTNMWGQAHGVWVDDDGRTHCADGQPHEPEPTQLRGEDTQEECNKCGSISGTYYVMCDACLTRFNTLEANHEDTLHNHYLDSKEPRTQERCGTCHYWCGTYQVCRRNPPMNSEYDTKKWPYVMFNEWCGEWKEARDDQR